MIIYFLLSFIKSSPVHLTDDNFTEFINSTHLPVFLKLWAMWCPHCKELAPTWDELSEIPEYDNVVNIADIECESSPKTCKKYEGENYPRLYWIDSINKSSLRYVGSRTLPYFRMFIKKQLNFPLIPINNTDELDSYTQNANMSTVVFFKINDGDFNNLKIAKSVASRFRSSDIRFIHYGDESIKLPEMIVYNEINRSSIFSNKWTESNLIQFIFKRSVPHLAEVNPYIMNFFYNFNISTFICVTNISRPFNSNTLEICDNVSDLFPITRTDCFSAPWFCRLVDIDINTSSEHFVIYNRNLRVFWVYLENESTSEKVYNWAKNISLNLVKEKGVGNGLFSPLKTIYYNQKSQGNPVFVVFIPPIFVILLSIYMIYMCCNEKAPRKKID